MKLFTSAIVLSLAFMMIASQQTSALYNDSLAIADHAISTGIWNPGKATICEVNYDPTGTDLGKEWIDIVNTGGYALNMTGYAIHFNTVAAKHYVFPSFSLLAGEKVRIHLRSTGTNTQTDLYWADTGGKNMGNNFGSVAIYSALPKNSTTIVDFVGYGTINQDGEANAVAAGIWTDDKVVPDLPEGHSVRLLNNLDHNLISDWVDNPSPI